MNSPLTFLYIAVRNVVRNRQKTLTSVLGIILAITLIFGETISLRFQSGAVMKHEMEKLDYHFAIYGHSGTGDPVETLRELEKNLSRIDGVGEALYVFNGNFADYRYELGVQFNGVNISRDSPFYFSGQEGNLSLPYYPVTPDEGGIVIPRFLAEKADLNIGDEVNLSIVVYEREYDHLTDEFNITIKKTYLNRTFTISGFSGDGMRYFDHEGYYDGDYYYDYGSGSVLFNGNDFLSMIDTIIKSSGDLLQNGEITLDLSYYSRLVPDVYEGHSIRIARDNSNEIKLRFLDIRKHFIENPGYYLDLESSYERAFENAEDYLSDSRWVLIALSIPLVLFGIYLGYLGTELFLSERRREIGMLKARGATNKQVISLLVLESVFTGAFAGFVGIFIAGFGARVFMRFTQASGYIELPWYDPGFSVAGLVTAVVLGIILMVLSSFHMFRKVARLEAAELLSKFSVKEGKTYSGSRDIQLIVLALISTVVIKFYDEIEDTIYSVDNEIVWIFLELIFYLVIPLMVILAPYIIIFSGVRLATRGSRRLYSKIAETAEMIAGDLGYLIRKSIVTGERRITNLTTVLSVLFAFLILTSTFYYAEEDKEERIIKTEIGSDLMVIFSEPISETSAEAFAENLTNISGVDSFSIIGMTSAEIEVRGWTNYVDMLLIDSTNFSGISYIDRSIFVEGDRKEFRSLATGKVLISEELAEERDLDPGDNPRIIRGFYNKTNDRYETDSLGEVKVSGVLKTLPGMDRSGLADRDNEWMVLDIRFFSTMLEEYFKLHPDAEEVSNFNVYGFIVKVKSGFDHKDVGHEIEIIKGFDMQEVRIASEEIYELKHEPYVESSLLVLRTELGLLIFISLLASGGIVYISSFEKRREMATIMLKGTTKKQMYLLQFGEAMVVLIYSLIIGLMAGLISGWIWIFVFNSMDKGDVILRSYWPSFSMLPVIGAMILIFLAVTLLMSRSLRKIDLTKFIRWGS